MASKKTSPFAARLDALGITVPEAATIARLPVADVQAIAAGDAPVPDVAFRWLADDADALRRVDFLRRKRTESLHGPEAAALGFEGFPTVENARRDGRPQ